MRRHRAQESVCPKIEDWFARPPSAPLSNGGRKWAGYETRLEMEKAFQMSQWLGRFRDHKEYDAFHFIFVGGRQSIGGLFVQSLVGEDHKEFSAEVQYVQPVCDYETRRRATDEEWTREIVVDLVKVIVHLVPALSDATGYKDESYFRAAQSLVSYCPLIFCIDMSETRLRGSVLRTLQELKPDWSRTVIALTFADALPALVRHRDNPAFSRGQYFNTKLAEWTEELKAMLERSGVEQEVVAKINICPVADEPGDLLPNGEPWLPPLSLAIMEILSPEKKATFLEEHTALLPTVSAVAEVMTTIHVGTGTETQSSRKKHLQASSVSPVLLTQSRSIRAALSRLRKDCPVFGILVIGRTGVGKSTLINNLLGKEVASVGHTLQSETPDVNQHEVTVEGVQIVVYDTPGLGDVKGEEEERRHLKHMEEVLAQKIHLVVYCFQMNNTTMTSSIVGAIRKYHQIGVDWKQSVIALTFADALYVPKREQALPKFRMSNFFEERLAYWQNELEKVGLKSVAAAQQNDPVSLGVVEQSRVLNICPTSLLPTDDLPNGNQWYVPLWLRIVEILSPAATVRFLDIHRNNICDEQAPPPNKHFKLQLQLTRDDKNRVTNTIAVTIEATGMDSSEVLQAFSNSSVGDVLKLFTPEQAGQSGSEPEQSTLPRNLTQSAKVVILSQNVHGRCESRECVINTVEAERNLINIGHAGVRYDHEW